MERNEQVGEWGGTSVVSNIRDGNSIEDQLQQIVFERIALAHDSRLSTLRGNKASEIKTPRLFKAGAWAFSLCVAEAPSRTRFNDWRRRGWR